jgi:hypothetical protein
MMEQRGLATLPVSPGGTPARENGSELGNAALPVLDSGQGGDAEVEDVEAELWAGWLGRRRGGTAGEARRNVAELTEATAGRNGRR